MVVYFCILVFQHISWNLIALTLANSSIQWCNHTISVTPASSSSHGKNVIFHCINFIADTCWQNVGKNNLGRWVVAFLPSYLGVLIKDFATSNAVCKACNGALTPLSPGKCPQNPNPPSHNIFTLSCPNVFLPPATLKGFSRWLNFCVFVKSPAFKICDVIIGIAR